MIVIEAESSWPYGNAADLGKTKLKAAEKLYLGELIASKSVSVKTLVNRYKLNKRTLSDYKTQFKNKIRPHDQGGRPRLLSQVDENDIIRSLCMHPTMSEADLRVIIREKHQQNWAKMHPDASNSEYKRISVWTVKRYSSFFRSSVTVDATHVE